VAPAPDQDLFAAAEAALRNAYAPYSGFRVGAAVRAQSGAVYPGCNVENSSYGLTNCAERTAIFAAVAAEGPALRVKEIAIATDPAVPCSPCGACRQVIAELGGPHCRVVYRSLDGIKESALKDLLPDAFSFLRKKENRPSR
jgi:cytidine deaminase